MALFDPDDEQALMIRERGVDPATVQVDKNGGVFPRKEAPPPPMLTSARPEHTTIPGAGIRGFGKAILPTLAGGGVATAVGAGLGLLGGPAAPVTVPAGIAAVTTLGAALAATMASSHLQEKGLDAVAKARPGGWADTLQKDSAIDTAEHPYAQLIGGLPASKFGGGTFLPRIGKFLTTDKAKFAKMAGIQGGLDAGVQIASNGGLENFDLQRTLLAAGAAPLFAGARNAPPESIDATIARITGAKPTVDEGLAAAGGGKSKPTTTSSNPLVLQPEKFAALSPEGLISIAGDSTDAFSVGLRKIAEIKRLGIEVDAQMVHAIGSARDPRVGGRTVLSETIPKKEADARSVEELGLRSAAEGEGNVTAANQNELAVTEATAAKEKLLAEREAARGVKLQADASAQQAGALGARTIPEARITEVRQDPSGTLVINQPRSTGQAEASARAIQEAAPQQEKASLAGFAAREKQLAAMEKQLGGHLEGSPEHTMVLRYLNNKRQALDKDLASFLDQGLPEELSNTSATTDEVVRPRKFKAIDPADEPLTGDPQSIDENGNVIKQGELPLDDAETGYTPIKPPKFRSTVDPSLVGKTADESEGVVSYTPEEQAAMAADKAARIVAKVSARNKKILGVDPNEPPLPGGQPKPVAPVKPGEPPAPAEIDPSLGVKKASSLPNEGESYPDFVARKRVEDGYGGRLLPQKVRNEYTAIYKTAEAMRAENKRKALNPGKQSRSIIESHPNWDDYEASLLHEVNEQDYLNFYDLLPTDHSNAVDNTAQAGGTKLPVTIAKLSAETFADRDILKAQQKAKEGPKTEPVVETPATKSSPTTEPESRGFGLGALGGKTQDKLIEKAKNLNPGKLIKSVHQRIKDSGALGTYYADASEATRIYRQQKEGPAQQLITEAQGDLNYDQRVKIGNYLLENFESGGKPTTILLPNEQKAADALSDLIANKIAKEKESGPYIRRFVDGVETETPFERQDHFWAKVTSQEVDKLNNNPTKNPAEAERLRQEYIDHVMNENGVSKEAAEKAFASQLHSNVGPNGQNPFFRGSRLESGIGPPKSWIEPDPFKAARKYVSRHYTDLEYHEFIESNPVLAKAMNLESNGKGEAIPDDVEFEGRRVRPGELLNTDTQTDLKDYMGYVDPHTQEVEKWMGLVHSAKIGPISGTVSHIQTLGHVTGMLKPGEYKHFLTGWRDMFTTSGFDRAIKAGSVRPTRNVLPTVAEYMDEGLNQLQDAINKYTGRELMSRASDVWLDTVGRAIAESRIRDGDTKFLKDYGPPDWQYRKADDIINFAAAKFTRNFAGAYDATDQPPALSRGSGGPLGTMFKLSRWPVGRFNRWRDQEYKQAKEGNFVPLLVQLGGGLLSVEAINFLKEQIIGQKPRELSWSEFFKLGGDKDAAYTLFSKVATASQMGLMGDILFMAAGASSGEGPRGSQNLLIQSTTDLFTRLSQFTTALGKGTAEFGIGDLSKLVFEIAKDNIQALKLVTEKKKDTGEREERLARRAGYLPPKSGSGGLSDPFSEAGAYRAEDEEALARIFKRKLETGQRIDSPDSEIRSSSMIVDGKRQGYYDFIEDSQGAEEKKAARDRDRNNTTKKRKMFSSALRRARE